MVQGSSIFEHVVSPMPRYLMRIEQLRKLIELLPQEVGSFLEIGPGLGDLGSYLISRFPHAKGTLMDFSETGAKKLSERFATTKGIEVLNADFLHYPLQARYDLIVACEVLEHIEDDLAALRRIQDRLNPGGHFLMSVPAFMRKWQAADVYAGHYRRYERAELGEKLAVCGFEIEHFWCYGFPVTQLTYPLRQWYYAGRRDFSEISKEDATKKSGVDRPFTGGTRRLPVKALMKPFFLLQDLARDSNVGDGFLVLARKSDLPN